MHRGARGHGHRQRGAGRDVVDPVQRRSVVGLAGLRDALCPRAGGAPDDDVVGRREHEVAAGQGQVLVGGLEGVRRRDDVDRRAQQPRRAGGDEHLVGALAADRHGADRARPAGDPPRQAMGIVGELAVGAALPAVPAGEDVHAAGVGRVREPPQEGGQRLGRRRRADVGVS
jgi:hypothetical protein